MAPMNGPYARLAIALMVLLSAGPVAADPSDNYQRPLDAGDADPQALRSAIERWLGVKPGRAPAAAREQPAIPDATTAPPRAARVDACPGNQLSREEITELQALLNEILGEDEGAGAIDGACGRRTRAAIARFEHAQGLPQRGVPTRVVLERVREVGATVANRAIVEPAAPPEAVPGGPPQALPR